MFPNEFTIVESKRTKIKLTSHRIVSNKYQNYREIILTDLISYDIVLKRNPLMITLCIIFSLLTFILHWYATDEDPSKDFFDEYESYSFVLALIFFSGIFTIKKEYFKVVGKYSSIEFPISDFTGKSMDIFKMHLKTILASSKKPFSSFSSTNR